MNNIEKSGVKIGSYNIKSGILADEMGLGKTITSISLILEKPYVYKPNNIDDSFKFETRNIKDYNYLVSKFVQSLKKSLYPCLI